MDDLTPLLAALGISALTDMQREALELVPAQADTTLLAPTGSGKTLAFLLPVWRMLSASDQGIQCLIVAPSRELALQTSGVWRQMGTSFRSAVCYGGHDMRLERNALQPPPAVLTGTPGRLLDHLRQGTLDISGVKILVLDEFDKCLSADFDLQMADLLAAMPALRHRILVSATDKFQLPAILNWNAETVIDYTTWKANEQQGLTLQALQHASKDRTAQLSDLLYYVLPDPVMVFCNERLTVAEVTLALQERGIDAVMFHGGMEQVDRERHLAMFRNGSVRCIVATDLASRGLDIAAVGHVIHYQLPGKKADFIHRNGRTARMGAAGNAYILPHDAQHRPAYLPDAPEVLVLPGALPRLPLPEWITMVIHAGKKDKISRGDIAGFILQKGHISAGQLGKIEVFDHISYAAVERTAAPELLPRLQGERLKGKKYRISTRPN